MMLDINEIRNTLFTDEIRKKLAWLYCCEETEADSHAKEYLGVLDGLEKTYGNHETAALFSAPGRTEIGGNHTDHQHGCVVAASVNMDMIAAAAPNGTDRMRLTSEGYEPCEIGLDDLCVHPSEQGTSVSILRGVCAAFAQRGAGLKGLDIYMKSDVPGGSGISSSAAFETLLGTVMNEQFMAEKTDAVEIAKIGQWVENVYFGKPCGLMDQMASSVGGVTAIDFKDPSAPEVEQLEFDLARAGICLCIIDSGADHSDLTDEYAAVPAECRQVAETCGYGFLRDVPEEVFKAKIAECRGTCGDRAVLRAIHFFSENRRAQEEADAVRRHDYSKFLKLVNESGHSSWEYLQNISPAGAIRKQAVALTIALAKDLLQGQGAVRVHGGGFAGTVQAFVPVHMIQPFIAGMETVLAKGACHVMSIRPAGGIRIL